VGVPISHVIHMWFFSKERFRKFRKYFQKFMELPEVLEKDKLYRKLQLVRFPCQRISPPEMLETQKIK
jgi:hypothetical protein